MRVLQPILVQSLSPLVFEGVGAAVSYMSRQLQYSSLRMDSYRTALLSSPLIPLSPSHYRFHWYRCHKLVLLPRISKSIASLMPRLDVATTGAECLIATKCFLHGYD
jgi:hypothetical protein